MTAFVGIDLAWTARHESGFCVVTDESGHPELAVIDARVATAADFAKACASFGDDVIVAVDAPLVVGEARRAERELARVYGGKYKASPYSANTAFLRKNKFDVPLEFTTELRNWGFSVVPSALRSGGRGRMAVEVFPHPAHIRLFELPERIAYKKGPLASRRIGLRLYQDFLGKLLKREMPLVAAASEVQALLKPESLDVPGKALKRLEDKLDALTCAYVAYHLWRHGPDGFEVFGSDAEGAIVVPLVPALHAVGGGHAHELEDAGEGDA